MSTSHAGKNLKRYKDLVRLFWKYGRGDVFKGSEYEALLDEGDPEHVAGEERAEELANDLEKLGPTYVKLGQLLSTRPDLVSDPYLTALARLQDKVGPFPYEEVEEIVQEDLGVRISKAFQSFDEKPLAAASLGQVHAATLRDGRPVVVKIQRPGIRKTIAEDLEALSDLAEFLTAHTDMGKRYGLSGIVEQFGKSLIGELDYEREARHLLTLRENLKDFRLIEVPAPIADYSAPRVLTMEQVDGTKLTKLSPLIHTELDADGLADELFEAYLQQVLVDGFFHADPHPGNVFLTHDHRIALLDLGMVAHVSPRLQEMLLQLLLAIAEERGDEAATAALRIGKARDDADLDAFRRRMIDLVAKAGNATVANLQIGGVVMEVTRTAAECGIEVPPELSMLGKMLLNLDGVASKLAPDFDPNAAIRRHAESILRKRMVKNLAPGNIFTRLIEAKDLMQRLPERLNVILDAVAENKIRLKVDAIDEKELLRGFQKIANRITVGLVLAAMIVAAAMIMNVETAGAKVFGYPWLASVLFLGAIVGGAALVVQIMWKDK